MSASKKATRVGFLVKLSDGRTRRPTKQEIEIFHLRKPVLSGKAALWFQAKKVSAQASVNAKKRPRKFSAVDQALAVESYLERVRQGKWWGAATALARKFKVSATTMHTLLKPYKKERVSK